MSWRVALLFPLFAAIAVGVMIGVVLLGRDDSAPSTPGATSPVAQGEADANGGAKLRPESNVCQSLLHRPDASAERTFPAIYTRISSAKGISIVADDRVSEAAIKEAQNTIERMFRNNDLADALAEQGAYVVIADAQQGILDLPEFGCLDGSPSSNAISHACGVADRADYPVVTVNELDLTGNSRGPCGGLNILFHELGHLVQGWTLPPADYFDIKIFYQAALDAGKYPRDYARTNTNEYFAEATQAYFFHVNSDGSHDRAWLKKYDPDIYNLLASVYGE